MHSLEELMAHIARVWRCDPKRYPRLEGMNDEQGIYFLVNHSLLHIAKTTGKIAALCEAFDHEGVGSVENDEALRVLATKLFVNSLKLAEETGLTASDLLSEAPKYVK